MKCSFFCSHSHCVSPIIHQFLRTLGEPGARASSPRVVNPGRGERDLLETDAGGFEVRTWVLKGKAKLQLIASSSEGKLVEGGGETHGG